MAAPVDLLSMQYVPTVPALLVHTAICAILSLMLGNFAAPERESTESVSSQAVPEVTNVPARGACLRKISVLPS
jgi:hypothetical protein